MFSLILLLLFIASVSEPNHSISEKSGKVGKVYTLQEIFNVKEEIVFSDLCTVANKHGFPDNIGYQNASSDTYPHQYYFDQERHYKSDEAELMVKFLFSEPSPKHSREVWEKYLMHNSVFASENMFFILRVKYNGEEYINAKRIGHFPLRYEQYSIVEMTDIYFSYERNTPCTLLDAETVINVECNFQGRLLNEKGNRSIQLDGIRFKFQVLAAVSTSRIRLNKVNHTYEAFHAIGGEIPGADFNVRGFKAGEKPDPGYKPPKYPCFLISNKPFACYMHKDSSMVFNLAYYDQEIAVNIEGASLMEFPGDTVLTGQWIKIPPGQFQYWEKYAHAAAANVRF